MGAKVKKSLRRTLLCVAVVSVVVTVTQALDEDASGSFVLSRARRSPQWQYTKNGPGSSSGAGRVGDPASGGNVRFLNLFNTDPGYGGGGHYNRPGGHYGGGASGQGSNFGFSLNYGQQNYHHRPNYGGGGYYDPHYDHHSQGYYDPHHQNNHHHHHTPPYPQRPPYSQRPPYGDAPPYQHYPYQPPGGFHGGFPPGYYHGRSAGASNINAASVSNPKKE